MKQKHLFIGLFLFLTLLSYPIVSNYVNQENILFRYKPLEENHQFDILTPHEEKFFTAEDGGRIHGVHMKTSNPKGVVVYYHGQGENIQTKAPVLYELFTQRGYDIITIDYRGFGKSTGVMNEKRLLSDSLIAYKWAQELYNEDQIIVYGCSLGTSMAAYAASQAHPKMLILESPYYNMIDLGKYTKPYYPYFIVKSILKYHLRTDLFLDDVTSPIFIVHGTEDSIIPLDASKKIWHQFKDNKELELTIVEGAHHHSITRSPLYRQKMDQLFD